MFGRGKVGMGANAKFIISEGKRVGNIKVPPERAKKSNPAVLKYKVSGRDHLGAMGKIK